MAEETNISQLEHFGLDSCRDKGIKGFKCYVAYSVLAYNLIKWVACWWRCGENGGN
ncbi:MAG: hypothetical protein AAF960_04885 [Bacteroidota bacterium]